MGRILSRHVTIGGDSLVGLRRVRLVQLLERGDLRLWLSLLPAAGDEQLLAIDRQAVVRLSRAH